MHRQLTSPRKMCNGNDSTDKETQTKPKKTRSLKQIRRTRSSRIQGPPRLFGRRAEVVMRRMRKLRQSRIRRVQPKAEGSVIWMGWERRLGASMLPAPHDPHLGSLKSPLEATLACSSACSGRLIGGLSHKYRLPESRRDPLTSEPLGLFGALCRHQCDCPPMDPAGCPPKHPIIDAKSLAALALAGTSRKRSPPARLGLSSTASMVFFFSPSTIFLDPSPSSSVFSDDNRSRETLSCREHHNNKPPSSHIFRPSVSPSQGSHVSQRRPCAPPVIWGNISTSRAETHGQGWQKTAVSDTEHGDM